MTAWVFEALHCPTLLKEIKKNKFKFTHHLKLHKHFVMPSFYSIRKASSVFP